MTIEQSIRQLVEALVEAWNRHDATSFSRLFDENADYVTGAGIRLAGRGQIRDAISARAQDPLETGRVSLVTESIRILGPDAAMALCAWQMDAASRTGESTVRSGLVTIVTRRTDDTWQIVALHNTDKAS